MVLGNFRRASVRYPEVLMVFKNSFRVCNEVSKKFLVVSSGLQEVSASFSEFKKVSGVIMRVSWGFWLTFLGFALASAGI